MIHRRNKEKEHMNQTNTRSEKEKERKKQTKKNIGEDILFRGERRRFFLLDKEELVNSKIS